MDVRFDYCLSWRITTSRFAMGIDARHSATCLAYIWMVPSPRLCCPWLMAGVMMPLEVL